MGNSYYPTMEWESRKPEEVGLNRARLSELHSAIAEKYSNIGGIVVVRNGYIGFEKYYNGYGENSRRHITSVTKSVVSALVGIAIDAGSIKSVDQKALDFFPEYKSTYNGKLQSEISIFHLLTMTAPYLFEDWNEPLERICEQEHWEKYIWDMFDQDSSPGTFKYSTAGVQLLSSIITRATGMSAREYANERLFRRIGIAEIPDHKMEAFDFENLFGEKLRGWAKDPQNNSTGGFGLTLTAREMARFGLVYLNHGAWGDEQVVSGSWIEASTSPHSKVVINGSTKAYGYLWWLCEDNGTKAYLALGDGGNAVCCIPNANMVVAILSDFIPAPEDRWSLIQQLIIPAILAREGNSP